MVERGKKEAGILWRERGESNNKIRRVKI